MVPGEGGANLSQQCDKAVLPYSTISFITPLPWMEPESSKTSGFPPLLCSVSAIGSVWNINSR